MQTDLILLDTNVISHARKQKPHPQIKDFLEGLRHGSVAICTPTIFELERGALTRLKTDPEQGLELLKWLERFLQTDLYLLPNNMATERLTTHMSVCGPLQNFWVWQGKSAKGQFGSDPKIAAIAIIHEVPIATCNVRDFLRIHEHFPLPGLYDPMADRWHVDPPPGWFIGTPANDSRKPAQSSLEANAFDIFKRGRQSG